MPVMCRRWRLRCATPAIDTIDPHYRTPSSWKGNLAVDHTLPWFDLIATAEVNLLKVERRLPAVHEYQTGRHGAGWSHSLQRQPLSNFGAVINMSNTSEGGSQAYTLRSVGP